MAHFYTGESPVCALCEADSPDTPNVRAVLRHFVPNKGMVSPIGSVSAAIIFYNVYECCSSDEETATKDVDTLKAGANVIIADGTENNINGSYVAKIYKSYELNADGTEVIDSKNFTSTMVHSTPRKP